MSFFHFVKFANRFDYAGKGFVAGMNGASAVYNQGAKEIYYVLPAGMRLT